MSLHLLLKYMTRLLTKEFFSEWPAVDDVEHNLSLCQNGGGVMKTQNSGCTENRKDN